MNDISTTLEFLKQGMKVKRPSYLLKGWRKRLFRVLQFLSIGGAWIGIVWIIYRYL